MSAFFRHRHYVLFMVTLVYVVNYLDRQILAILLPFIKNEFDASDTALGLLTGPAFALIYATLGIPLALLADRMNRRNVIAISLALFSVFTIACNYVGNFWQLVAARAGVGIGEAGTGPSINSILSDLYPPQERAKALGIYSAGLNIGLLIAFFGGAVMAQRYGWRSAFLVAGLGGIVILALFLLTVEEPKRGHSEGIADSADAHSLVATAKYLWSQKSFRFLSIGTSMSAFGGYAGIAFVPSFLVRTHHLSPSEVGLLLSITTGIFGFIGTAMSGVIADRVGKKDIRRIMLVPVAAALLALPFAPVFYLSSNITLVIVALALPQFLGASYLAPAYAATQGLVPLRMRATAAAILIFILNIIALSFGPLWVGAFSDFLRPYVGEDSLRYALLSTTVTSMTGALLYYLSSRHLTEDMAKVTQAGEGTVTQAPHS